MRLRLAAKLFSAFAIISFAGLGTVACSKQGEAERCEIKNGNLDCVVPLTCVKKPLINDHICCPAVATTPECKGQIASPSTDAGVAETAAPVDTGAAPADTATADAATADTATTDTEVADTHTDDVGGD